MTGALKRMKPTWWTVMYSAATVQQMHVPHHQGLAVLGVLAILRSAVRGGTRQRVAR